MVFSEWHTSVEYSCNKLELEAQKCNNAVWQGVSNRGQRRLLGGFI